QTWKVDLSFRPSWCLGGYARADSCAGADGLCSRVVRSAQEPAPVLLDRGLGHAGLGTLRPGARDVDDGQLAAGDQVVDVGPTASEPLGGLRDRQDPIHAALTSGRRACSVTTANSSSNCLPASSAPPC